MYIYIYIYNTLTFVSTFTFWSKLPGRRVCDIVKSVYNIIFTKKIFLILIKIHKVFKKSRCIRNKDIKVNKNTRIAHGRGNELSRIYTLTYGSVSLKQKIF